MKVGYAITPANWGGSQMAGTKVESTISRLKEHALNQNDIFTEVKGSKNDQISLVIGA